ncbi:hypothetical protein ACLOJK_032886 [Asimina triloba]
MTAMAERQRTVSLNRAPANPSNSQTFGKKEDLDDSAIRQAEEGRSRQDGGPANGVCGHLVFLVVNAGEDPGGQRSDGQWHIGVWEQWRDRGPNEDAEALLNDKMKGKNKVRSQGAFFLL